MLDTMDCSIRVSPICLICMSRPLPRARLPLWEHEWSRWFAVAEADAHDYPEDERNYSASGVHIDTDNLQIHSLTLLQILL